jgi:hypothetical protein
MRVIILKLNFADMCMQYESRHSPGLGPAGQEDPYGGSHGPQRLPGCLRAVQRHHPRTVPVHQAAD